MYTEKKVSQLDFFLCIHYLQGLGYGKEYGLLGRKIEMCCLW